MQWMGPAVVDRMSDHIIIVERNCWESGVSILEEVTVHKWAEWTHEVGKGGPGASKNRPCLYEGFGIVACVK